MRTFCCFYFFIFCFLFLYFVSFVFSSSLFFSSCVILPLVSFFALLSLLSLFFPIFQVMSFPLYPFQFFFPFLIQMCCVLLFPFPLFHPLYGSFLLFTILSCLSPLLPSISFHVLSFISFSSSSFMSFSSVCSCPLPSFNFFSFPLSVLPFLCFLFPSPSLIFYSFPPSSCISFLLQICLFLSSHGGPVSFCMCAEKNCTNISHCKELTSFLLCSVSFCISLLSPSSLSHSPTGSLSLSLSLSLTHIYRIFFSLGFGLLME